MARKSKQTSNAFDMLAFQDAIMSTTGIMLLFTLLLILTIGADRIVTATAAKQSQMLQDTVSLGHHTELNEELLLRQQLLAQLEAKKATLAPYLQTELNRLLKPPLPAEDTKLVHKIIPPTTATELKPLLIVAQNNTLNIHWENEVIPVPTVDNGFPDTKYIYNYLKPFWRDPSIVAIYGDLIPTYQPVANPADAIIFLVKPSAFEFYSGNHIMTEHTPHTVELIPEEWEIAL